MKCVSNYVAGKTRSLALNLGLPVPESFLIPSGSSVSLMSITLLVGGSVVRAGGAPSAAL